MSDQHPITPPPELVTQWTQLQAAEQAVTDHWQHIATQAAQWGADQELEACCEWVAVTISAPEAAELRAARRPKPPSKVDLALKSLEGMALPEDAFHTISRAIQRLKELEAAND